MLLFKLLIVLLSNFIPV